MPIFQAIGLGILILVLQCFVPNVLHQLEATTLAFLRGAELSANVATSLVASADSAIEVSSSGAPRAPTDFRLPQVSQIHRF